MVIKFTRCVPSNPTYAYVETKNIAAVEEYGEENECALILVGGVVIGVKENINSVLNRINWVE